MYIIIDIYEKICLNARSYIDVARKERSLEQFNHRYNRAALAERITAAIDTTDAPRPLRTYQREALEKTRSWLQDPEETRRAYINHATGLGKTMTFSTWIRYCPGLRVLVIVPTLRLVMQTARALAEQTGSIVGHMSSLQEIRDTNGRIIATKGFSNHAVVVATNDSFKQKAGILARHYRPHLIIYDECHWSLTERAQGALWHFSESVIIGFTGTPDFLGRIMRKGYQQVQLDNGQVLFASPKRMTKTHFQTCLDERSIRWGIQNKWLAPLAWMRLQVDASLDDIPIRNQACGLDYDATRLQERMSGEWSKICTSILDLYARAERGLAKRFVSSICPGIPHAKNLAENLTASGVSAFSIASGMSPEHQMTVLDAFESGYANHLSSVFMLREGWDAPIADVASMLRPLQSVLFYQQCVGRIARPYPDGRQKIGLIIDLEFQNTRYKPISAPLLFAQPGEALTEGDYLIVPPEDAGYPPSPYLPPKEERILTQTPASELEYIAEEDGTFLDSSGEQWARDEALTRIFQIKHEQKVWSIVVRGPVKVPRKQARTHRGHREEFFHVPSFREAVRRMYGDECANGSRTIPLT